MTYVKKELLKGLKIIVEDTLSGGHYGGSTVRKGIENDDRISRRDKKRHLKIFRQSYQKNPLEKIVVEKGKDSFKILKNNGSDIEIVSIQYPNGSFQFHLDESLSFCLTKDICDFVNSFTAKHYN